MFYHGIMISSSFERVMSPLRTRTNGGDYKLHMTKKKWQTQRVKLFLFGHTMKTTKQNDKNPDKTEGLWIGKLKHCKDKVGGIKWTDKPTKTLGIYFGHDKEECEKLNWEK